MGIIVGLAVEMPPHSPSTDLLMHARLQYKLLESACSGGYCELQVFKQDYERFAERSSHRVRKEQTSWFYWGGKVKLNDKDEVSG